MGGEGLRHSPDQQKPTSFLAESAPQVFEQQCVRVCLRQGGTRVQSVPHCIVMTHCGGPDWSWKVNTTGNKLLGFQPFSGRSVAFTDGRRENGRRDVKHRISLLVSGAVVQCFTTVTLHNKQRERVRGSWVNSAPCLLLGKRLFLHISRFSLNSPGPTPTDPPEAE